jgi:hypothetical protein
VKGGAPQDDPGGGGGGAAAGEGGGGSGVGVRDGATRASGAGAGRLAATRRGAGLWDDESGGRGAGGQEASQAAPGGAGSGRGEDGDLVVEEGDAGVRHGLYRGAQAGGEEGHSRKRLDDVGDGVRVAKAGGQSEVKQIN